MNNQLVLTIAAVLAIGVLSTVAQDATNGVKWAIVGLFPQAHASIIGDFGAGYQYGKTSAYNGYSDNCPSGYSNSYCAGFHVGWNAEYLAIQQAQP